MKIKISHTKAETGEVGKVLEILGHLFPSMDIRASSKHFPPFMHLYLTIKGPVIPPDPATKNGGKP